jgi:hypothetical protein
MYCTYFYVCTTSTHSTRLSNCATTVQSTNLPELGRSRIRSTSYRGAHSVHINTLAASRNWRDQPPTFLVTAITLYQWWTGPQTRAGTRLRREGQASRDGERMTFLFLIFSSPESPLPSPASRTDPRHIRPYCSKALRRCPLDETDPILTWGPDIETAAPHKDGCG